jgi:CheY-like chemotaxis protein
VLVYTAFARAADTAWALDAGCDGFLLKPTNLTALLREVQRLAGRPPADDANAGMSGAV